MKREPLPEECRAHARGADRVNRICAKEKGHEDQGDPWHEDPFHGARWRSPGPAPAPAVPAARQPRQIDLGRLPRPPRERRAPLLARLGLLWSQVMYG
jgi:hypothetical protein